MRKFCDPWLEEFVVAQVLVRSKKWLVFALMSVILISCQTQVKPDATLSGTGVPVRLVLSGLSTVQVNACVPYLGISQDAQGASAPVETDVMVFLSALGSGSFFADPTCSIPTSFVNLVAGNASAIFYYKNTQVETDTVIASPTGLVGASLPILVDGPFQLALSGPTSIKTDTCKSYTLQVQNPSGAGRNATSAVLVNLLGASAGSFYSNSSCSTAITSVTIPQGSSLKFVYYKNSVVEDVTLEAEDDAGLLNAAALPVSVDGPTKLALSGPSPLLKNSCGTYQVKSLNPSDVVTPVNSATVINLSGAGAGSFYSDSNCFTSTATALIGSGASSVTVYYLNTTNQSVTLSAADDAAVLSAATLAVSVEGATKLALEGPTSLGAGACGTYSVVSQSASDSELGVSVSTTVNLSDSGSGVFYSDSSCQTSITSVGIAAFSSRATVYFMDNTTQSTTLTAADNSSTLTAGSLTVNVAGASKLAVVGAANIDASVCTAYQAQAQNGAGTATAVTTNTIVNLSGGSLGNFFSDSNCTSTVSQVLIPLSSSSATFYFKDTVADTAVLTATDNAGLLTAGSLTVTVNSPLVAVLEISEDPSYDFGTVAVGNTSDHSFTVSNTGNNPATDMKEAIGAALVTPFGFKGGSYPGTGGTCVTSLNQGSSCTIVVSFAPSSQANFSDSVTLSYNNSSSEQTVARLLSGTGGSAGSGSGGDLDTSFSGDGMAVSSYGPNDVLNGVAVQQSGKLVVAGATRLSSSYDYDIALIRYNSDGSVDTSFGSNGLTRTDIRGGDDAAYAVALQSSGKIIVVGYSKNQYGNNQAMAIVRYTSNGVLDTSFGGGDGVVLHQFSYDNNDTANAVVIDSSDRIVVVGKAGTNWIFSRYTSSGSADTSFGTTGSLSLSGLATYHSGLSVAIQSNGKIVAAGYAAESNFTVAGIVLVRLNSNGSADTSFDGDGVKTTALSSGFDMARSIALQSDGKIVVAGTTYNSTSGEFDFAVLRYTSSGQLDSSFDADGIKTFSTADSGNHIAESVRVDSNGKIVVAGYTDGSSDDVFVVARLNTDGSLDSDFGTDGVASLNNGRAHGMALQSDGKIVAVGESSGGNFVTVRFLP
ncbi:MAG: choice-of-anchor D domain-containing protein [Bdellovibrionales bacterium]|nr:choice-of-anchor D domain-containing protein [Bdellovibrionales bacterium]